jgi:hypothetical protein
MWLQCSFSVANIEIMRIGDPLLCPVRANMFVTWSGKFAEVARPTGEQLARALAARLGADGKVVTGWLQGVERLAHYAQAEARPEEDARDEERQSVQAALTAEPVRCPG